MNWNEEVEAAFQDAHFEEEQIDGLEYEDGFIDGVIRGSEWQRYRLRMPVSVERLALAMVKDAGFDTSNGWPGAGEIKIGTPETFKAAWMEDAKTFINALLGED